MQNRAEELIARAEVALAAPRLAPRDRALVLTQAGYGQIFSGDFVGGEETARRARQLAQDAGSAEMTVWSACALSVAVKMQGRYAEALALARKVIILDLHEAGAPAVGALAFLALSLGVAYWLIDDRTHRRHASERPRPG